MLRSISELGITALVWSLWLYLLMPMIGLVMWLVSGQIIYMRLFEEGGLEIFFSLIRQMGLIILICFAIIQGWAYYNFFRFGKRERRKQFEVNSYEEKKLSEFHQLPVTLFSQLRIEREIVWPPTRARLIQLDSWLSRKRRKLAGHHVEEHEDEHDIHFTRFHEIHPAGEPSIVTATCVALGVVFLIACLIILALMP